MSLTPAVSNMLQEYGQLKSLVEQFFVTVKSSSMAPHVLQSNISRFESSFKEWTAMSRAIAHHEASLTPENKKAETNSSLQVLDDLIAMMEHIAASDLPLPTSTAADAETVAASAVPWTPFQFQPVNAKKYGHHLSCATIIRAAVAYEKGLSQPTFDVAAEGMSSENRTEKARTPPSQLPGLWADAFIERINVLLASEYSHLTPLLSVRSSDGSQRGVKGAIDVTFTAASGLDQAYKKQGKKIEVKAPRVVATLAEPAAVEQQQQEGGRKRKTPASPALTGKDAQDNMHAAAVSDKDAVVALPATAAHATEPPSADNVDAALEQLWGVTAAQNESQQPSRHCLNPYAVGEMQQYGFGTMGYIESCFKLKYGTPRQGAVVPSSRACLTLHSGVSADAVQGLTDYSHVWVVFVFHSNTQAKYKPKICPPRLGGQKVGCLATRTPHRWNDIGLSLVKLDRVETPVDVAHLPAGHPKRSFTVHGTSIPGCARVYLSGVDLVDGTPVLDIKPYHPSDLVPKEVLRLPQWLAEAPLAALEVQVSAQAQSHVTELFRKYFHAQVQARKAAKQAHKGDFAAATATADVVDLPDTLLDAVAAGQSSEEESLRVYSVLGSPLSFYRTRSDIVQAICETLSMDPRPICTKKRHSDNAIYGFMYDNLNVIYRMSGEKTATISIVEMRDEAGQRNRKRELMNKHEWLEMIKEKIEVE